MYRHTVHAGVTAWGLIYCDAGRDPRDAQGKYFVASQTLPKVIDPSGCDVSYADAHYTPSLPFPSRTPIKLALTT